MSQVFRPEADGRDKIVISVVDSGVGISKSDKVKLFKLFGCLSQVEQDTNQGIGIGLAICDKLVKAFEGRIGLRSKLGVGSQFSFSIILNDRINSNNTIYDSSNLQLEIANRSSTIGTPKNS